MFSTRHNDQLYLQTTGQGPPLVLLHSWCGSSLDWIKLIEPLAQHFKVFAWDARGHGKSQTTAGGPYTLNQMADDLQDLLIAENIVKPVVIGHSMGASVLWQYLKNHKESSIHKMVVIDQPPKMLTDTEWHLGIYGNFTEPDNKLFEASMAEDFPESILKLAAFGRNEVTRKKYEDNSPGIVALRDYLKSLDSDPLIAIWQDLIKTDYRPMLSRTSVSTLLIYGEKSNYYGKATADYMHQLITNSKLYLYEDADHSPHLKNPERFMADVLDFIGLPDDSSISQRQ